MVWGGGGGGAGGRGVGEGVEGAVGPLGGVCCAAGHWWEVGRDDLGAGGSSPGGGGRAQAHACWAWVGVRGMGV